MRVAVKRYARRHKGVMLAEAAAAWEDSERLQVREDSDQNKVWPPEVLLPVLREATPEFRALVTTLLLTGQRLSDVCSFRPEQYAPDCRTLGFSSRYAQQKTGQPMMLHVPDALAGVLDSMRGRHPARLLVTPRGRPWTTSNAQESLAGLRVRLGIDRHTLHGLRATGVSYLAQNGAPLHVLMAITGHRTEAELRKYLRGIDRFPHAKIGQEGIASHFAPVLSEALEGANTRSYSGITGKAAANAGLQGQSSRRKAAAPNAS